MECLYILKLVNNKYYIGKSTDVPARYKQHKNGNGCAWTSKYHPIKLIETRKLKDEYDETNVTKDYMKKYGIDNVRGGAYCQLELPTHVRKVLEHELHDSSDSCYSCGEKGHFANACSKQKYVAKVQWQNYSQLEESDSDECFRCGRDSHWQADCYAKYDIDGDYIED